MNIIVILRSAPVYVCIIEFSYLFTIQFLSVASCTAFIGSLSFMSANLCNFRIIKAFVITFVIIIFCCRAALADPKEITSYIYSIHIHLHIFAFISTSTNLAY